MTKVKIPRIESLDWLRGLMALSIMFYHLTTITLMPLDSSDVLGRLGVYGVSIFFVLSGLSMAIVYHNYIKDFRTSLYFFIRRIFRIWPLLWLVCLLVVLPQIGKSGAYSLHLIFLNITTLFGFVKPTAYIAVGAWSIGNEMVYYALTPLIIYLYNYKRWIGNGLFIVSLIVGMIFSFYLLNPYLMLSRQWAIYVNPFNNFFLYIMGIAIYYNFKDIQINQKVNIAALLVAVALFCWLPFSGNQISILTGLGRICFVGLSFVIVFCFYKIKITLPHIINQSLENFGIATYGVYLFHPVMYFYINMLFPKLYFYYSNLLIGIVSVSTLVIAIISYKYFELRFIKIKDTKYKTL